MKSILKSNGKLLYGIAMLSVMLLSLSYGIFVITSSDYKASELMVGNLLYGITIHDTDKVLQSNPVTVETGETTLYITISSVNSISSKYTLAYDNNSVTVSASNKSGWNASGSMTNYNNYAYSKTVKVKVTNNSGSSQNVTFAAFGGYSYNSASNIPLGSGWYSVANFSDVTQISGEYLTDIVEEDTNCSSSTCLYGGEATTNYFSFEEDGSLYRILGTYTIDNEKTTKIAANTLTEVTTSTNLSASLNTIKSSLDTDHIYSANKFNCQGTNSLTCTASSYNDVGILSLDEYKQLEGDNDSSYLYDSNEYYLLNGNNLVSNTNQSEEVTSAKVRPAMYLEDDVKVTGSGTVDDPYVLEQDADFNLVAIYLQNDTSSTATSNYTEANSMPASGYKINETNTYCMLNGVIDTNAVLTTISEYYTFSNLQKGEKCYIYFDIVPSFIITGTTNNNSYGTITSSTISYGGTTQITITPASGYYLSDFSCTNGYTFDTLNIGGFDAQRTQIAKIKNNYVNDNTICTAIFNTTHYCLTTISSPVSSPYTSGTWTGTYSCTNGVGTIISCSFTGTDRGNSFTNLVCDYHYVDWRRDWGVNTACLSGSYHYLFVCSSSLSGPANAAAMGDTVSCSC